MCSRPPYCLFPCPDTESSVGVGGFPSLTDLPQVHGMWEEE